MTPLFKQLQTFSIIVNPKKCVFAFLGNFEDAWGTCPVSKKAKPIIVFLTASLLNQQGLYLGMFQFYHGLLPKIAKVLLPFTVVLASYRKLNNQRVKITPEAFHAFVRCKEI